MKYIQYLFASILLFFVPIHGLLVAVAVAIILDTFTGVFKSIKIHGLKSIRSRKLSTIISKMLLYEVTILLLFLMDKYLLNEFVILWWGIEFMFTKMCAIVLIFIELVSVKENIEEAYKIDIWKMLKHLLSRAKEIKSGIDDLK
jgi:hypothetical protein